MKKYTKILLSICLCVLLAAGGIVPALAVRLGDVTSDEEVTAEDARAILRAAVGLDSLTEDEAAAADMDCDGVISAADARLALRVAVGLNLTPETDGVYADQYEILRSGTYYMELDVGDDVTLTCTVDGSKKYISTSMNAFGTAAIDFAFFTEGDDLWFVDEKHEVYTKLDEDAMGFLGEDAGFLDEFSEITDQIGVFSDLKPLNEADEVKNDTFFGTPCTSYFFHNDEDTVIIYMDGVKLLGIERTDAFGLELAVAQFAAVNAVLPASAFNFRERYTKIGDLITFMLIAYGEALGGDEVTPEDIQKLIDEAKEEANNG